MFEPLFEFALADKSCVERADQAKDIDNRQQQRSIKKRDLLFSVLPSKDRPEEGSEVLGPYMAVVLEMKLKLTVQLASPGRGIERMVQATHQ